MAKARLSCQSGVFSLLGAVTLLLALVSLVLALDSGRLYMEQRKLQKLADTAALETVARLDNPRCGDNDLDGVVEAFAKQNAQLNGFSPEMMKAECVSVTPTIDEKTKIADGTNTAVVDLSGNAVQTIATETVPASLILRTGKVFGFDFDSSVTLQAKAVAERSSEPTAVFSIGAQLLRLNNNKLIGSLLRDFGLTPEELRILDSDGVATASITPSGLLKELGVELSIHELKSLSPEELASLSELVAVTIARLIDASIGLVDGNSTLASDLKIFNSVINRVGLNNADINLLSTPNKPGLLSLASGRDDGVGSALDARLNLSEVLGTAILIGASGRAIHVPELNMLGLANVELGIVEPPSLAVGPVGTTAYNAQVRLYADIDSNNLLGGALSWLTDSILGIRVHLPLSVDVTTAQATFVSAQCHASPPTATFDVDSTLLNACIGKIADDVKWSGSARCEQNLEDENLVKLQPPLLSLLGIPAVNLTGKVHLPSLSQKESLEELNIGEHLTENNEGAIGTTAENITIGLLDLLAGLFRTPQIVPNSDLNYSGMDNNMRIRFLANSYLEKTKNNSGTYNIDAVTDLILKGDDDINSNEEVSFPRLVEEDWMIPNSIPKSCVLGACSPKWWTGGKFSEAFHAYTSIPYGVLDVVGIPTLGKGFQSCAGLLSALLNWNKCVEHNLTKLLQDNAGQLDLAHLNDGNGLLDPESEVFSCNGPVCLLVKPLLVILKPILNGVGEFLTNTILSEMLGLEAGRSTLAVHDINCGAPRLVSMGSGE